VLPEPLLSASVLRAITDDQEAMACWVAAEREEAQARLLAALEEARAWQVGFFLFGEIWMCYNGGWV